MVLFVGGLEVGVDVVYDTMVSKSSGYDPLDKFGCKCQVGNGPIVLELIFIL